MRIVYFIEAEVGDLQVGGMGGDRGELDAEVDDEACDHADQERGDAADHVFIDIVFCGGRDARMAYGFHYVFCKAHGRYFEFRLV